MQDETPWHDDLSPEEPKQQKPPPLWKFAPPGWIGFLLSMWLGMSYSTHASPPTMSQALRQNNSTPPLTISTLAPPRVLQLPWLSHVQQTSPQKVKGRETLTLSFHVPHSTKAPKAYLVYRNLSSKLFGKVYKVRIRQFTDPMQQDKGSFQWSLKKSPFGPGDLVEYFVEVEGSNPYSCLQRRQTSPRYLKFFSPIAQHCQIMEKEKKLLHLMVDFLADLLETQQPQNNTKTSLTHDNKLHQQSLQLQSTIHRIYQTVEKDEMSHRYSLVALAKLQQRISVRNQQRQKLLQSIDPTLCLLPTFQKKRHLLWQQEIKAHENDIHAVQRFLYQQESDLVSRLKQQLVQAHSRVQHLATRYQQNHHPSTKIALASSLQHLDRLLRHVKRHIK